LKQADDQREARRISRIQAIAENMVPAKHLAIWARVRGEVDPDIHPSEVWRALVNGVTYKYDADTGMFFLSKPSNTKEA
jgi:hypothetical protein